MSPSTLGVAATPILSILFLWMWAAYFPARQYGTLHMIRSSAVQFGVPILCIFAAQQIVPFEIPIVAVIAVEEALKVRAARKCVDERSVGWFVASFGFWEMLITKSFVILLTWGYTGPLVQDHPILYTVVVVLPAGMHASTAAIYDMLAATKPFVAVAASLTLHSLFNMAAPHVFSVRSGHITIVTLFVVLEAAAVLMTGFALWACALRIRGHGAAEPRAHHQ